MNTKVKAAGKLYRVQKVARNGNDKALHELTMTSGKKEVTMRKGTFLSAKDAAAKALTKQKVPA